MKRLTCTLLIVVATAAQATGLTAASDSLAWGDQGDGTYKNPVINADFSDPDVIRVGRKYYMVASDFHFMGMQVLESEDMVNWQYISQIYHRFDEPGWDDNRHYAGGSWAPAIRYHDGLFYVYFCTPEEGLYMSTAEDPHGPWAPLNLVQRVEKWEDPCPLWDTDGMAYLGRSRHGAGPIIVHKMSPDGRQLLDEGVTVYEGPIAEGTKWLKRNGWYYLIIPEGGVGTGWQTVLRSKNIYGPYERKIVLEQGSTAINGPHQGALVDTPDGEWWFYHFQETPVLGRVVHLQPVHWQDDWPLMGIDYDGNGIGEPVASNPSPKISASFPSPKLGEARRGLNKGQTLRTSASISSPESGEVRRGLNERQGLSPLSSYISSDFIDDFNTSPSFLTPPSSNLKLAWQWNHNPDDSHWSLTERPGFLTIHAQPADSLKSCRNMLTQKVVGYQSESTTVVEASGNCQAGLFCSGKLFRGIGICPQGIFIEANGQRQIIDSHIRGDMMISTPIFFRVSNDCEQNRHQFYYSTDGKSFIPAGDSFPMRGGYWKGIRVGLFCYGTDGMAHFDAFRQSILK